MTVSAPPRPPRVREPVEPYDPVARDDPEALIEEARQRARRRRRIYAVAAAGLALLGASLVVVFGRPGSSQSAASEPPALPIPADDEPATVVAQYAKWPIGWVFVYDDGRVLWHVHGAAALTKEALDVLPSDDPLAHRTAVALERRLTADGLELVRSRAIKPIAFLREWILFPVHHYVNLGVKWTSRASLPAGLWADTNFKAYEPSRYEVCMDGLPAAAQALLRGNERTFRSHSGDIYGGPDDRGECFVVSAEEAKALEGTLPDPRAAMAPILPHGQLASGDSG